MVAVPGKGLKLDGDRLVWLAVHPEKSDKRIVRFMKGEKDTTIIVSVEALDALCRLHLMHVAPTVDEQKEPT